MTGAAGRQNGTIQQGICRVRVATLFHLAYTDCEVGKKCSQVNPIDTYPAVDVVRGDIFEETSRRRKVSPPCVKAHARQSTRFSATLWRPLSPRLLRRASPSGAINTPRWKR